MKKCRWCKRGLLWHVMPPAPTWCVRTYYPMLGNYDVFK